MEATEAAESSKFEVEVLVLFANILIPDIRTRTVVSIDVACTGVVIEKDVKLLYSRLAVSLLIPMYLPGTPLTRNLVWTRTYS